MRQYLDRMGFGGRLSLMVGTLVLGAVLVVSAIMYNQYRDSVTESVMNSLEGTGEMNAQSFMDWLEARQEEMRYLASLDAAEELDNEQLEHLLERIAESQGFYDTIFVVDPDGRGVVGVDDSDGTRVMPEEEVHEFQVPDREWFQAAIGGEDTFSRPVVSRATGTRVSTVAIPIRRDGEIVGVMRGAVDLDTILDQVGDLAIDGTSEIYLLDRDGLAVTPTESIPDRESPVDTHASRAIQDGDSGVARYSNPAGTDVVGSYTDIPLLGWGLVLERPAAEALAEIGHVFWLIAVVTVAVVITAVGFGLLLVRSVLRTIGGDPAYAADVVRQVADGDMTVEVATRRGDQTSLLASIASMKDQLRRTIGDISTSSNEVASAATELSQINEETEAGIQQQNSQLNSSATAMNEMSATVEEVARNTQQVAEAARSASEEANSGREVVAEASNAIQGLADEVNRASQVMDALKGDSDNIGTILQVIRDVADQTNLLALNAAIEAARAGESGRGFAVVADEVRTLASRTQQSTAEIQETIEKLQGRAAEAVQVMHNSHSSVEKTVEHAGTAGTSLESIAASVSRIDEMVQQIASAAEQQSATAQEINQNIHGINDIAEQSAGSVNQSKQASESLSRLAEDLRGLVQKFRV